MPPLNGSERTNIYVGVDPGMSGGIAFLCDCNRKPEVYPIPTTETDLWNLMMIQSCAFPNCLHAVVELVTGYVGGVGNTGSSQFKFGRVCGLVEMSLVAAAIPYEKVTPRIWQQAVGVTPRKKTESKTAFKNRLKACAQRLFPGVPVTLKTCDALLIAEFCRRKCEGCL